MAIEIDSMQSDVEILPRRRRDGSVAGGMGTAGARDLEELKEILRPVVMELISEELETYMRMRG